MKCSQVGSVLFLLGQRDVNVAGFLIVVEGGFVCSDCVPAPYRRPEGEFLPPGVGRRAPVPISCDDGVPSSSESDCVEGSSHIWKGVPGLIYIAVIMWP